MRGKLFGPGASLGAVLVLFALVMLFGCVALRGTSVAGEVEHAHLLSVRRFGATGDGRTDDTAAIQRAVDEKAGTLMFPPGTYRIAKPIVIDLDRAGPVSLVGFGTARVLMAGPGPAFRFVGTHQGTAAPQTVRPEVWQRQRMPTVDGLEIVGHHPEAVGIEAQGTMQLILTRLNVRRCLHAVHLVKRNRNVIVANCHLYENRGVGLYLDDVNLHQINVLGCHISYNAGGGVVSRAGNVRNLHVTGCDIEGNMPPQTGQAPAAATANVLIDCTGDGYGTAEVAITGCTIQHTHRANDSANIRYIGSDSRGRHWGHLAVANNVLSDVQVNIDVRNARGVSIVGNTLWKGVQHDIRIVHSSDVVVGPNVLDRNPQYQDQTIAAGGVRLEQCSDCTITGLHIAGVRQHGAGLELIGCRRINVSGTTVVDCEHAALLLDDVAESRISACLFSPGGQEPWQPVVLVRSDSNQVDSALLRQGNH